jgi:(1->4)-alpha-D-glucan 1-alpha-D-glucosylmutase
MNAGSRVDVAGAPAPDPNEEWQIYQTLVGAWPLDRHGERGFPNRMAEYVLKSLREAKVHSSWLDPDLAYEAAVERFVRSILRDQRFRRAFGPLRDRVAFHGAWSGLAQALVKLTAPGIPDLYQGTELWSLALVDPDNRRPVDFEDRQRLLQEMDDQPPGPRELVERWRDGRVKLWVTSRALRFRRANGELFSRGGYLPLKVTGPRGGKALAFARRRRQSWAVTVVPVRAASLHPGIPIGEEVWGTASIGLPASAPRSWTDVLTGEVVDSTSASRGPRLRVSHVLGRLPVALLAGGEAEAAGPPHAVA